MFRKRDNDKATLSDRPDKNYFDQYYVTISSVMSQLSNSKNIRRKMSFGNSF